MQYIKNPNHPADSRRQLKAKLELVGDSFSISRLTESGHEQHHPSSLFPHRNEPTLDLKENQDLQIPRFMESDLGQYPEGLTARYTNEHSTTQHLQLLESKVEHLTNQLQHKEREVEGYRNELDVAKGEIARLNKEKKQQADHIRRITREVEQNKDKGRDDTRGSRSSSFSDSCANFYPELLSPQETVELLGQLLRKVGASNSMSRSISSNPAFKDIVGRMGRN